MLKTNHIVSFFVVSLLTAVTFAQGPTTAPSADETSILEAFKRYNAAMAAGDEATLLSLQHALTDDQKQMAKAIASNDLAVGKLKSAVAGKFDADAAKKVASALGDVGDDDLVRARVQTKGDKAMVAIGSGGIPMIKVDGNWLFDMTEASIAPTPERVKAAVAQYESRVKKLHSVTAGVNDGKFDSVDQVIAALADM